MTVVQALDGVALTLGAAVVLAILAVWAAVVVDVCRSAFTYDPWIDPPRMPKTPALDRWARHQEMHPHVR